MSEAPAELWLRPSAIGQLYATLLPDEPDAVRYVRAGHEMSRERAMSEAPAELWLRPSAIGQLYATLLPDEPDAVRYVRAGHEMSRERAMSEAPAELWVSPGEGEYAGLWVEDGPGVLDEVRYVRADLYEALVERHNSLMERMGLADYP